MNGIEWADPPTPALGGNRHTGESKYVAFGRDLRERPGEWARIVTGARSQNCAYAKKHLGAEFEVTSRKVGPDNHDIYARYVGDEVPS